MPAALVQFAKYSGQNATMTVTLPSPVVAGNLLVLAAMSVAAASPTPTISLPTGGGTPWVEANTGTGPFAFATESLFYLLSATGGATTVSCASTAAFTNGAILMEFSGVSPVLSQPDAVNQGNGNTAIPTFPPQLVTVRDADLLVSVMAGQGSAGPITVAGGYTKITDILTALHSGTPQFDLSLASAWRATTVHGGYLANWGIPAQGYNVLEMALALVGPPAALTAVDAGIGGDFAVLTAPAYITVPAAVIDRPDRHIYGGVDLATYAVIQRRSSGGDSHPALRGENPAWSGLPGTQPLEQLPGSRIYTIDLFVHGMTAAGGVSGAEDVRARINLDALQTVLATGVEQPLIRVMPDGTGRQALAKVWSVQEIDGSVKGFLYALRVEFYLADPWFYSNSVIDSNRALSSTAVSFALTHPGTVRGHHVLLDLLGPMTDPRINNLTTGTWVQYTGAIGNNQRLLIDAEHFSAFLAGANVVGNISHGGGVPFLWIAPGVNSLLVQTAVNGGTLTTTFSPPYI